MTREYGKSDADFGSASGDARPQGQEQKEQRGQTNADEKFKGPPPAPADKCTCVRA